MNSSCHVSLLAAAARRAARVAVLVAATGRATGELRWPVHAAGSTPALRWSDDNGDHLTGSVHLRATVSAGEPADGWVLSGLSHDGGPALGSLCDATFKTPRRSFDINCRWDTARSADGGFSANGHYLLRVEVRRNGSTERVGDDRATSVDNAAVPPTAVAVTLDRDARRATVTWAANPEPDIAGYVVEERIGRRSWKPAGQSTTTSFARDLTEPGDYAFRVAAERRRPDGEAAQPGAWTEAADRTPRGKQRRASDDDGPRAAGRAATTTSTTAAPETPAATQSPSRQADAAAVPAPTDASPGTPPAPPAAPAAALFPASSGAALDSLRAASAPAAGPDRRPRTHSAPPAVAEPDPGFDRALPYASSETATEGPAAEPAADSEATAPAAPVDTGRRTHGRLRLVGLLLIAGAAVLAVAVRPTRRPGAAPGPDDATAPASSGGALQALEARINRLEAQLTPATNRRRIVPEDRRAA